MKFLKRIPWEVYQSILLFILFMGFAILASGCGSDEPEKHPCYLLGPNYLGSPVYVCDMGGGRLCRVTSTEPIECTKSSSSWGI